MKKLLAGLICLAVGVLALPTNALAISVTPTNDASTLANTILGSGITASNFVYTGGDIASGTFTGGAASGIGIESGIILTSGQAIDAVGPNSNDGTSVDNGAVGDSQLDAIVAPNDTENASILEFDFTTTGGDLFFSYVFASEEYNEFVNTQFNDVFAFFLDGVNIALIPGTSTPVSINTVNGGGPTFGVNPSNPGFFNNNDLDDGGPLFDIEYDGFTDVFVAQALGLAPGTHHIKLAIADTSDAVLDSAVFIQAGSFSDTPPDVPPPASVPEPATLTLLGAGLLGIATMGRRRMK